MWEDPIVAEVRKAREELLARYNGDLAAMVKDLQAKAAANGRPLVSLPPRRVPLRAQPKYRLDEMLSGITDENIHPEIDMWPPAGKEVG
jgi:antitoxin component of MazEF toxin-antitoxin module